MIKYLKLIRVKHYLKNFLIFIPLFFGGKIFDSKLLINCAIGFLSFSLAASVIYIVNDLRDIENDRKHPIKSKRPLASGSISVAKAKILLIFLIIASLFLNYLAAGFNLFAWAVLVFYVLSNLAYSMGLKNVVLVDVLILVLGYILRLYYGALLVGIEISSWLYLTVISMAFFLGFGKRRNEMQKQGDSTRKVLAKYNKAFLDKAMYMFLGLTVIFYSLWCERIADLQSNQIVLFTVPLVILICLKYSLDIEVSGSTDDSVPEGDPVEVLYKDKTLLVLCAAYVIILVIILYAGMLR